MNSDVKVKRAPPWMNSSFIIKLMFHNQDGAIKSKSKELEKREMTALPYICSVVKTHSYSRVGKGVIIVGLTAFFLFLLPESQDRLWATAARQGKTVDLYQPASTQSRVSHF